MKGNATLTPWKPCDALSSETLQPSSGKKMSQCHWKWLLMAWSSQIFSNHALNNSISFNSPWKRSILSSALQTSAVTEVSMSNTAGDDSRCLKFDHLDCRRNQYLLGPKTGCSALVLTVIKKRTEANVAKWMQSLAGLRGENQCGTTSGTYALSYFWVTRQLIQLAR